MILDISREPLRRDAHRAEPWTTRSRCLGGDLANSSVNNRSTYVATRALLPAQVATTSSEIKAHRARLLGAVLIIYYYYYVFQF